MPISALFRTDGRWSVFLVEGDRAVLHQITIGQMNDSQAEVLEGLKEGVLVVLYPNDLLKDGSLVERRSVSR